MAGSDHITDIIQHLVPRLLKSTLMIFHTIFYCVIRANDGWIFRMRILFGDFGFVPIQN